MCFLTSTFFNAAEILLFIELKSNTHFHNFVFPTFHYDPDFRYYYFFSSDYTNLEISSNNFFLLLSVSCRLHIYLVFTLSAFTSTIISFYYYYYYYYYLVCEAIGTAATHGLLCQPRMIVNMIVEKQMECRLAGETNRSSRRKPAPAPLLSITKLHMTRPGFEPGPPRWEPGD
jgi:hypothetical protein